MKSTKTMIITAMFAAVIAVLAQIAFPLPSGVPVTLQTFAVALTGVVLGAKLGTISTFIYILLGAVGVPVFSGFNGGLGAIVGKTGGFIWGFLFLAFFAGAGAAMMKGAPDSVKKDASVYSRRLCPWNYRPPYLPCARDGAVCHSREHGLLAGGGSGFGSLSGQGCLFPGSCLHTGTSGTKAALPVFFSAKASTGEKSALTQSSSASRL